MKKKQNIFKKIFFSGWFFPIVIILAMLLSMSFLRENNENKTTDYDLETLKKEIEGLEEDNKELGELIEYFNSNFFVEKEAREKLGLKKDGEKVAIVPENDLKNYQNNNNLITKKNNEQTKEFFPRFWWDYFFAE
ncbi:septum formation initiator family protein [Candidatus Falkowbacteria bacterium]|jgi:cell division protein FtsB|nr:septum formation initiator family protein [Candidatus Falkowbacteria bacterium]MBT4432909.1 septum formation initiator family protein [Candidatus Falkowbacteria bacterium]